MAKGNGIKKGPEPGEAVNDHKPKSDSPFESERFRHSEKYPAFQGTIEFDLTFELFGQRVTRKARVDYTWTPDWEYFDLVKNAPHEGWGGNTMGLEIQAIPNDGSRNYKPEWVEAGELWQNGILSPPMSDAIDAAIEEQCRTMGSATTA